MPKNGIFLEERDWYFSTATLTQRVPEKKENDRGQGHPPFYLGSNAIQENFSQPSCSRFQANQFKVRWASFSNIFEKQETYA